MTAETRKQLEGIYKRYQEHGVTLQEVIGVYNSAIEYEVPPQQAIIGVRLVLANTYGEHELFTVEDVAAITGETPEEVTQRIEDSKEELLQSGAIMEVSSPLPGLFN